MMFRSIFAPTCRLSFVEVVDRAEQVNDGLASIASLRKLQFVRMQPKWYGVDPIHIRPGWWHPAWQYILGQEASVRGDSGWLEALNLYFMDRASPPA